MSKELLTDEILRQAVRMAAEKNYQDAVEDARLHPHTFRPDFHKKMRPLLKETALFTRHTDTGRSSRSGGQSNSFLRQLHARKPRASSLHLRRRYLAVASLLMIFVSAAALASETVRNSLRQLRLQFFSDNVTVEAAPETDAGQTADGQTKSTATGEFHAYKWKEVPEGYEVTFEEENPEFGYYIVDYEDSENNFINYMQSDTSYTTSITYDEEKGYKYEIQLKDGSEAYSISDGRRNTIFYEKNGYLFSFMSNQSEEVIIDYINLSGILEYEY